MLKYQLRTALRRMSRHKGFSMINLFGLALGTACCLYILLYVGEEYSYDEHHADVERIFRITTELETHERLNRMATCSPPIPEAMKRDFPEVEEVARVIGMFTGNQQIFRLGEQVFYERDGAYADSAFFKLFSYPFLFGNPEKALAAPNSIVLSETTARRFFGSVDPVGMPLDMDTGEGIRKLIVSGVFGKPAGKTHIQANYFLSMDSGGIGSYALTVEDWAGNNFTNAYIKLKPHASASSLESKLPDFLDRYAGEVLRQQNREKRLSLQPITDIHTTTGYDAEPSKTVSPAFLSILLLIAGLIQVIACINFMNLSTARAAQRAREIGVRKVVGANRKALVWQFLSESMLFALLAMLLAVPLVNLLLPLLNQMTGVTLSSDLAGDYMVWLGILVLGLFTGLLAGSYPSLYLSGFRLDRILKNEVKVGKGGHVQLRQALVVVQFIIAISLIAGVIVIRSQLDFLQDQDLGYEPQQKLVVPFRTRDALKNADIFRDAIGEIPGVRTVARANNYPSQFVFNDLSLYAEGQNIKEAVNTKFMRVDERFTEALGIELMRGRNFKQADTTGGILANETMLQALAINPDEAVGQHLFFESGGDLAEFEIVGLIRDFNFSALYSAVTPFMLVYNNDASSAQMIIDADTEDYERLIAQLRSTWERQIPGVPFEYAFIDEEVMQQYEGDRRLSRIISSFTFLAILISCLGLFGLVVFNTERRTKEIGIRKVLGASVSSIVALLSRDLVALVLIASFIAIPLAWILMHRWLQDFAYQVTIQWWMFALAGLGTLAVALLTVSFQSIKAALANPVDSLRSE